MEERTTLALGIAKALAPAMFHRYGRRFPLEDILSLAQVAAVKCAKEWDGRGNYAKFTMQRMRWAITDGLRNRRRLGPRSPEPELRNCAAGSVERAAGAYEQEVDAAGPGKFMDQAEEDKGGALRRLAARAAASFTVDLDAAEALQVPDPKSDVEKEAHRMRVRRAVDALPPMERSLLVRHSYEGWTIKELAEHDSVAPGTIYSRLGRAMDRLRETLEE